MSDMSPPPPPSSGLSMNPKEAKAQAKAAKAHAKAIRPWYKKKRYIALLALAAIIAISLASSGGSDKKSDSADKPADKPAAGSGENEEFALGETAHTGDFDVTLNTVEDPFVPTNEFEAAEAGRRLVAVELTFKNTSDKRLPLSTLLGFEVKDSESRPWNITFAGMDLPQLDGEVPSGESRKGWAVFEVAEDSTGLTLRVKGSLTAAGSLYRL